jgi:hypothetical protein
MIKRPIINIISNLDPIYWKPLIENYKSALNFIVTNLPINADFHIVYSYKAQLKIPNCKSRIAFVVTEPPEIEILQIKYLEQFGKVFSPDFNYLRNLSNLTITGGLLLWQAGFTFESKKIIKSNNFDNIINSWFSERPIQISIITSNKEITPLQKQRLNFVKYLELSLPEVEIFGRGFREIEDKSQVLLKSKYHIALENSIHNGYWTEKLIDPLICGTQIIYCGDQSLNRLFKSVVIIDINDFDKALAKIRDVLKTNVWERNLSLRKKDYINFMEHYNLLKVIENWVQDFKDPIHKNLHVIKAEKNKYRVIYDKLNFYLRKRDLLLILLLKFIRYFSKKNNSKSK